MQNLTASNALKYNESFLFLQARKLRQVNQLVLLNNLQRDDQNISSTLLVTLLNRTMAGVYDNRMQVKFLPSQGINQDQINSYNTLAQSDYLEMDKAQLDYDWTWDTLFFGRGYLETIRFDMKRKIMQPHVINPLVLGYDPYFEKPDDWRYYWKWITRSKWEVLKLIKAKVITGVTSIDEIPTGVDPYLWAYKIKRDAAKKAIEPALDSAGGDVFQILEFYGYDENGNKCVFWYDKTISIELMRQKLDLKDGEQIIAPNGKVIETGSRWPIVVKEAFREPHSSVTFSVADLLEDKHRAKSVLLNLAFIAAKDTANPIYGYNPDKVRDITQFFSRQISQHIPMDDDSAAWPLNKAPAMSADLQAFIQYLDSEAEEPVGAGKPMSVPGGSTRQTATQAALDQQLNDMAQSLQSKVLQFGEKVFWSHWFHRYAANAGALGSKMANIVGVKGVDTKEIDLKDFQTDFPPGVMIYSAKEAEYKELVEKRDMMEFYPNLAQTTDANGLRNFNKFVLFPLMVKDSSLIDVVFPKSLDEIKAEEENVILSEDKKTDALETDDHQTHIYVHYQVQPKTWAAWFHIRQHEEMLATQIKQNQAMQQAAQAQGMQQPGSPGTGQSQPQFGKEKRSPMEQAAPLKTETKSEINR